MWRLGRSLYRGPVSKWGGLDSPPHYVHLPSTSQVIPETGISFQNRQENFGLYCICLSPFLHSTAPPRSFPPPHTLRVVRIIVNTPSWRPSAQCTSSYAWAWTPPCSRARPICWHSTNTQHRDRWSRKGRLRHDRFFLGCICLSPFLHSTAFRTRRRRACAARLRSASAIAAAEKGALRHDTFFCDIIARNTS